MTLDHLRIRLMRDFLTAHHKAEHTENTLCKSRKKNYEIIFFYYWFKLKKKFFIIGLN